MAVFMRMPICVALALLVLMPGCGMRMRRSAPLPDDAAAMIRLPPIDEACPRKTFWQRLNPANDDKRDLVIEQKEQINDHYLATEGNY